MFLYVCEVYTREHFTALPIAWHHPVLSTVTGGEFWFLPHRTWFVVSGTRQAEIWRLVTPPGTPPYWTLLTRVPTTQLTALVFLPTGYGWLIGSSDYRTQNGCTTWTVYSPTLAGSSIR